MDPLHWFQTLDGGPAILVIGTYFIGCAMLLVFLGRLACRRIGIKNTSSSVAPAISVMGTMTSILIGLVIVSLWSDYRAARANVAAEGTELRGATRDARLLSGASGPLIVRDLRDYARAVTDVEWPAMNDGRFTNGAGHALAVLIVAANRLRTPAFDLRARVNRIGELRTLRLAQTSSSVVGLLWFALLVIPVLVLAGIGLLNDLHVSMHYPLAGLAALAISIAVFVALELDLPFNGIDGLSPAPIATAVDLALSDSQ